MGALFFSIFVTPKTHPRTGWKQAWRRLDRGVDQIAATAGRIEIVRTAESNGSVPCKIAAAARHRRQLRSRRRPGRDRRDDRRAALGALLSAQLDQHYRGLRRSTRSGRAEPPGRAVIRETEPAGHGDQRAHASDEAIATAMT